MKILYVFPHPDDESFGPGPAIAKQIRQGHEVYLLTLTKGGATKMRYKLGLSVEEMGEVRYREMLDVEKTLGLTGMTVLDLPDSGLKEMDPREIETAVKEHVQNLKPDIIITYPVHGISGFHDHLVAHAAVTRVFCELKEKGIVKRLAFHTVTQDAAEKFTHFHLSGSTSEEIDCLFEVEEEDIETGRKSLDCYVTYKETIDASGIKESLHSPIPFEIYNESFDPPITDLTEKL